AALRALEGRWSTMLPRRLLCSCPSRRTTAGRSRTGQSITNFGGGCTTVLDHAVATVGVPAVPPAPASGSPPTWVRRGAEMHAAGLQDHDSTDGSSSSSQRRRSSLTVGAKPGSELHRCRHGWLQAA